MAFIIILQSWDEINFFLRALFLKLPDTHLNEDVQFILRELLICDHTFQVSRHMGIFS